MTILWNLYAVEKNIVAFPITYDIDENLWYIIFYKSLLEY